MASELATFEIGFYDPDSGSVSLEERSGAWSQRDVQLAACALFALRQLVNSNKNVIAQAAAARLSFTPAEDPEALLSLIAELPHPGASNLTDAIDGLKRAVSQSPTQAGLMLQLGTWGRRPFEVKHRELTASRRIIGVLEDRSGVVTLKTQLKGFGLFGGGLGFYGPASFALLTYHISSLNKDDAQRVRELMEVTIGCADVWLAGGVNVRNQASVAASVVDNAKQ